jgi:hypothetical protein
MRKAFFHSQMKYWWYIEMWESRYFTEERRIPLDKLWIQLLLIIASAVIGFVVSLTLDYIKKIRPRIEYESIDGIPIKVSEKYYRAYILKISSTSRKKVEDITFHLRAGNILKLENISTPAGLDFTKNDKDNAVDLIFPYLKRGDKVEVKAVAETNYYIPGSLDITFSSPNDFIARKIQNIEVPNSYTYIISMIAAVGIIASILIISIGHLISPPETSNQAEMKVPKFEPDRRDVVISAASSVGLPQIADKWLTAPDPKYYNEGDIAYSFAVASNKPDEIEKYRKLLSLTLGTAPGMMPESQANLFYSLGKLDLLLSDSDRAIDDFKNAIAKSRSIVEAKARNDVKTHKFLVEHGLL